MAKRKKKNENNLFPLGVVAREDIENPGISGRIREESTHFLRAFDQVMRELPEDKSALTLAADLEEDPLWAESTPAERAQRKDQVLRRLAFESCQKQAAKNPSRYPLLSVVYGGRMEGLGDVFEFVMAGENTLRLYPDLAAALVRTKVRAPREMFRMPYSVIEILPPIEMIQGWRVKADKKILPVPAFAIWLSEKQGQLRMTLHGGSPYRSDLQGVSHLNISVKRLLGGDGMFDEKAIREAVIADTDAAGLERGDARWEALRLAINAVLYMSSVESDVQPTPQTRQEDEQEERNRTEPPAGEPPKRPPCRPRALNIGRRVKLPGIRSDGGGNTGTGHKIQHQFWVRGHWRNQRCGPERSQTKLKWIQPFIKGRGRGLPVLYKRDYEAKVEEA